MRNRDACGRFEQLILTSIVSLGDNAYGITIHKVLTIPLNLGMARRYQRHLDELDALGKRS